MTRTGSPDHRLAPAYEALRGGGISVLSLDVFDTLLWRVVPEPVDAFGLLGGWLRRREELRESVPAEVFGRLRHGAEARARARLGPARRVPEVTLEEIYAEMPARLFTRGGPTEWAGLEVEHERTITVPDLSVCELVGVATGRYGARVVLVSDTYYSGPQLRRLVQRPELGAVDPLVLTSSEQGANKGSGLYAVMLRSLGVAPSQVLHVGDNPDADVARAAKEGICAVAFDRRPANLQAVLDRERPPLDRDLGDLGLTALRARAASTVAADDGLGDYRQFGATVLGPVLTGFAEWVHDRARAEGVGEVHCVMREGSFLSRLVEGAAGYLGSPVQARTIWLSRQVCSLAAVVEGSQEELVGLLARRRAPTLGQLCQAVGVEASDLTGLGDRAEGRLDEPDLRRRALEALAGDDRLRARVVEHCGSLRARLVSYVTTALGGADRAVLVDLGWGATIQAQLDRALAGAGTEVRAVGLYLLTNDLSIERMLDGTWSEGFLGMGGLPERDVRSIMRSPEILEQVCMAEVGSLSGFTEAGEPFTGPAEQDPRQVAQRTAVQEGVMAFQREWARYRPLLPPGADLATLARPALRAALRRFVTDPTAEEVALFGDWLHDENYGSADAETVVSGDVARKLPYMAPGELVDLPMSEVYWPFGVAAVASPPLARAAGALAAGDLEPDLFDSGEELQALIHVDLGAGALPRRRARVRRSPTGLCYLREQVATPALQGVGVTFPRGPGVVRLDWMTLTFSLSGRPEPVRVDVEWPSGAGRVRYQRGTLVSGNILLGLRAAPRLVFDCPPEWGADAYKVEVEMGFGWLASEPGRLAQPTSGERVLDVARRARGRAGRLRALARYAMRRVRE